MVVKPTEKTGLCHGGACPCVERGFESSTTLPLFCQRGDNSLTSPYLAAVSLLLLLLEERSGWKSPCEAGGMLLALSGAAAVGRAPCAIWAPLLLQRAPSWEQTAWAPGDVALPSCTALAREAQPRFGMGWEQTGKKTHLCWKPCDCLGAAGELGGCPCVQAAMADELVAWCCLLQPCCYRKRSRSSCCLLH